MFSPLTSTPATYNAADFKYGLGPSELASFLAQGEPLFVSEGPSQLSHHFERRVHTCA